MPRPKSILWVDDEIEALAPHRRFLETQGFTVASAAHGDDALAMLRRQPYSVVLLDEQMPGRRGLELLAQGQAEPPQPRFRGRIDGEAPRHDLGRHRGHQHDVSLARRPGEALVGRAKDRRDAHAQRGSQMHRPRVVRHQRGAPRQNSRQLPQVRVSDQVHDSDRGRQR